MHVIMSESLSIFSIIMLLLMLIIINLKKDVFKYSSRQLLSIMFYLILMMTYLSIVSAIKDLGLDINYYAKFVVYTIPLLFSPIIVGLFISYFNYKLVGNVQQLRKRHHYMQFFYLMVVLSIINIFYPLFFSIDKDTGILTDENHLYLIYVLNYLMFFNIYYLIVKKRKEIDIKPIVVGLLFFILPVIGSAMDMHISDEIYTWPMLGLTSVFLYLYLETSSESKDFLTDLYSRNSLDFHMRFLIDHKIPFRMIMFDLDKFKKINDEFGHHIGDLVLKEFSKILRKIFANEKMISRLGGDEFMVVLETLDLPVDKAIDDIAKLCKQHSKSVMKQLKFSYGETLYNEKISIDNNFIRIDRKLYVNKDRKKNRGY